jgi:hypothetical protein
MTSPYYIAGSLALTMTFCLLFGLSYSIFQHVKEDEKIRDRAGTLMILLGVTAAMLVMHLITAVICFCAIQFSPPKSDVTEETDESLELSVGETE